MINYIEYILMVLCRGLDFERGKLKKHKMIAHKMRSANMINHNIDISKEAIEIIAFLMSVSHSK